MLGGVVNNLVRSGETCWKTGGFVSVCWGCIEFQIFFAQWVLFAMVRACASEF